VVVKRVDRFGSVAKAGIVAGDEIVGLNGARLTNPPEKCVLEVITKVGVGGTVTVNVMRNGARVDIPVVLRAKRALNLDLEEVSEVLERKIAPN
jgi:S1-C subfamily serine protease